MAFVVSNSDEPRVVRDWPVVIPTALDGGKIRKDEITVDYEVISQSEIDDIIKSARDTGGSDAVDLLTRSIKSINGMVDESNAPIPFNDDALAEALNRPNQRSAMLGAFFDVHAGRKAARKNS